MFTKFSIETVNHNLVNIEGGNSTLASNLLQGSSTTFEELDVVLPHAHLKAKGMSCDSTGRYFAMSDGLSTFLGEATPSSSSQPGSHRVSVSFTEVARCDRLLGASVQDTAISCDDDQGHKPHCEVGFLQSRRPSDILSTARSPGRAW